MKSSVDRLDLRPEDREQLESWLRSSTVRKSLAERARIVLLSAEGQSAQAISYKLDIASRTVQRWRRRYREEGLAGLSDHPRPGQPRKLTSAKVQEILRLTTERIPAEATHWSLRLMAKYARVSRWQVQQVWQAADLKPHRIKGFKLSQDPLFAEKVVDVVGLYLKPPQNALVLSVDEKTQIQALDRTQPLLPLRPGQIERRTHDYKRHGTASLYAAFDVATGKVLGRVTQRHTAKDFLEFLGHIDQATPRELDLHLILDNSSTHKTADVQEFLACHPRPEVGPSPARRSAERQRPMTAQ